MGLLSTFLVPVLIKKIGLANSGILGIVSQHLICGVAVMFFYIYTQGSANPIWINLFFVCIVIARLPLWTFDLVEVILF